MLALSVPEMVRASLLDLAWNDEYFLISAILPQRGEEHLVGYETPEHPQMNQAESLSVGFSRVELSGAQCTGICFQLRPQYHLGWKKHFETPQFTLPAQEQPVEAGCPGACPVRVSCLRQLQGMANTSREHMSLSEVPSRGQERCFTAPALITDVCVWANESQPLCLLEHSSWNFSCLWAAPSALSWSQPTPEDLRVHRGLSADLNLHFSCLLSASWVCNHMVRYRALCWGKAKRMILFYKKAHAAE